MGSAGADSRIAVSAAPMSPERARSGWRVRSSREGAKSSWISFDSSPKRAAEAEPEVERHADHQGDVAALERGAAGAGEVELVVGRQAAPPESVEEDRDAERLGQLAQLGLGLGPVEVACRP